MKNFDAFKEHGDVIWDIANLLRGPYRPPQYRRVMIPLTALGDLSPIGVATYFLTRAEALHDQRPLDLLRERKVSEVITHAKNRVDRH